MSHGMVIVVQKPPVPPQFITLDVDDTADIVHGHQQMSLSTRIRTRCFAPIHIYDADTGHY